MTRKSSHTRVRFFIKGDIYVTFEADMPEVPQVGDKVGHPLDAKHPDMFRVYKRYWSFEDDPRHEGEYGLAGQGYYVPFFVDVYLKPLKNG